MPQAVAPPLHGVNSRTVGDVVYVDVLCRLCVALFVVDMPERLLLLNLKTRFHSKGYQGVDRLGCPRCHVPVSTYGQVELLESELNPRSAQSETRTREAAAQARADLQGAPGEARELELLHAAGTHNVNKRVVARHTLKRVQHEAYLLLFACAKTQAPQAL